jgi:hypothetical protein
VNALIVYDLAQRAERHRDPYEHLAEMYHIAELAWVRGEFKPFQKNSGRDRHPGALDHKISGFGQ